MPPPLLPPPLLTPALLTPPLLTPPLLTPPLLTPLLRPPPSDWAGRMGTGRGSELGSGDMGTCTRRMNSADIWGKRRATYGENGVGALNKKGNKKEPADVSGKTGGARGCVSDLGGLWGGLDSNNYLHLVLALRGDEHRIGRLQTRKHRIRISDTWEKMGVATYGEKGRVGELTCSPRTPRDPSLTPPSLSLTRRIERRPPPARPPPR